ncbi:non-canonical purine NTP pyrophosphatase [Paenibacillus humicus]|uniref:non-canonical purine NTP pyrophosphatase n=1 Tax=Paenibacillus humicus TaxID=412861 RepID=UPI003F138052
MSGLLGGSGLVVVATGNPGKVKEFAHAFASLGLEVRSLKDYEGMPEIVEDGDSFAANARIKAGQIGRLLGIPVLADDSGLCVDALGGAPGIYSARYAGPGAADADNNAKLLAELASAEAVVPDGAAESVEQSAGAVPLGSAKNQASGSDDSEGAGHSQVSNGATEGAGHSPVSNGASDGAGQSPIAEGAPDGIHLLSTARFKCALALYVPAEERFIESEGSMEGYIIDSPRGAGGFGYDPLLWIPALRRTAAELSMEEKQAASHRGAALRSLLEKLQG